MNFEPTPHEQAALRDGTLSLILRPVVPQPESDDGVLYRNGRHFSPEAITAGNDASHPCPLGQPGDVLAVVEAWQHSPFLDAEEMGEPIIYRAGWNKGRIHPTSWRRANTMPDDAVRYRLRNTEVRCLRVQDIPPSDLDRAGLGPLHLAGLLIDFARLGIGPDPYAWAASVEAAK